MGVTEDSALEKVKGSLEMMLGELNAMKATICVLLVFVEEELEKKEKNDHG